MPEIRSAEPIAPAVPPRIKAAQDFLYYTMHKMRPSDPLQQGENLTENEWRAHDTATQLLIYYFAGELDCGDVNCYGPLPPDDPAAPVPAAV